MAGHMPKYPVDDGTSYVDLTDGIYQDNYSSAIIHDHP